MKLPNFRMFDTQATLSLIMGVAGLSTIAGLSYIVFKGYNSELQTILYNSKAGLSSLRPYMVMAGSAAALLLGMGSSAIGFRSLGQSRNKRQGQSLGGLLFGAVCIAVAPVLFMAWRQLSEPMIQ